MPTDATETAVLEACARLDAARADVSQAFELMRSGPGSEPAGHRSGAFPRSALMRAASTREGRLALIAAAVGILTVRPGLIPLIWRIGRVMPVLPLARSLLNRYLVRRNAMHQ